MIIKIVYIQQTYINNSENTIEAIYKFPLDSEAAVESFEADIDGKSYRAKIYENEKANQIYEKEIGVIIFIFICIILLLLL